MTLPQGISYRAQTDNYRWSISVNKQRRTGVCTTLEEAVQARENCRTQLLLTTASSVEPSTPVMMRQQHAVTQKDLTLEEAIKAMFRTDWSEAKSQRTILINCKFVTRYFGKDMLLKDITSNAIESFALWLQDTEHNKPSSCNRKLAILSKLLTRAHEQQRIPYVPYIVRMPEAGGRIRYITPEEETEIEKLLTAWGETRFLHTVRVLLDTGMRCGELKKLTVYDIITEQGVHGIVHLHDTKNGDSRSVPLTARALTSLQYLAKTSKDHELLLSEYTNWITKTWNRVRKVMRKEHDVNFVPHILRHTCCTRLVQKGAPIKKVQVFMGHKSINTTMRYTHLAPEDIYDLPSMLEN